MRVNVSDEIAGYAADPMRVELVSGVLAVARGCGAYAGSAGLRAGALRMPPGDGLDEYDDALAAWLSHADSGELYAGLAMPARTALALFDAREAWASGINELEAEHGRDAIVRLVGLGLAAEALCEGDSDASAARFLETESGQAVLAWFTAVDVVLAFATSDEPIDADRLIDLLDAHLDEGIDTWAGVADERSLARARIIVNNWTDWMGPVIDGLTGRVDALADRVRAAVGPNGRDGEALADEAASIGIHRCLVARHVGEQVHGPLQQPPDDAALIALSTAREAVQGLVDRRDERDRLRADASQRLAATTRAHAERTDAAAAVRNWRDELRAQRQALAAARGVSAADDLGITHAHKRAVDALARARHGLAQAQRAAVKPPPDETDAASLAVRAARRHELAAHTAVLKVLRKGLDVRLSMQSLDARVHGMLVARSAACAAQHEPLRDTIGSLRKARRAALRAQSARSVEQRAAQERVAVARDEVERAKRLVRDARGRVAPLAKSIATLRSKQTKRAQRVATMHTRSGEHEVEIDALSESIAGLRDGIELVTANILERVAVKKEERRLLREEVRADLNRQRDQLRSAREALDSARSEAQASRERLEVVVPRHRERDDEAARVRSTVTALLERQTALTNRREGDAQLAVAARDMLRTCAVRLDNAHGALRSVQAASDALTKEHRLRTDRLRTAQAAIQAGNASTKQWNRDIAELRESTTRLAADLDANAAAREDARARIAASRAQRAAGIRSEQAALRQRIESLRGQVGDALEDKRGLVDAEARLDAERVDCIARRETVRARRDTLQANRDAVDARSAERARALERARSAVGTVEADLLGLRLTVDGAHRQRKRMQASVAICRERAALAAAAVVDARAREGRRVDSVADAQSWVDRTNAAIRTHRSVPSASVAPPSSPSPKAVADAPANKLDRLLKKVSANPGHVEAVPDPSAAPHVDAVSTRPRRIPPRLDADPDATQILPVGPPADADEDATEMFDPQALMARLQDESEDATVMISRKPRDDDAD